MAVREQQVRRLRRDLITRRARIWSRLSKSLVKSLTAITTEWLKKLTVDDIPEIPAAFTKELKKTLREALAYGYWLNHLYLQEYRSLVNKTKYHGKIDLADDLRNEDDIRKSLESFISFDSASQWHDVIPEEAVKWLEGYTPKLAGNLRESVLEKTRDVIQKSMQEGTTLQERMKALQEAAPEFASMSKARIESIARTEITRADTMGTLINAKANNDVVGFEFSAIMDDRTTDICVSRHGLVMRIDDPNLASNTPPLHPNCRSLLMELTIYDFPGGLNSSPDFESGELPESMNRPEDIEEVIKVLQVEEKPVDLSAIMQSEFKGTNYVTEDTKATTLDELREFASHGEMPQKITGSKEEQAKLYEEIDRLYERPKYIHKVKIQDLGSQVDIQYLDNYFSGIASLERFPSGRKASNSEREGVIKHRMYYDRAEMELRIHNMFAGFPTPEMQMKYQGKALTEAEKAAVTAEAERLIFAIMGSPVSPAGRSLINSYWREDNVRRG